MGLFKAMTWGFGRSIGSQLARDLMNPVEEVNEEQLAHDETMADVNQRKNDIEKQCAKITAFEYSNNTLATASKKAIAMAIKLKSLVNSSTSPTSLSNEHVFETHSEASWHFWNFVGAYIAINGKYSEMSEFFEATLEATELGETSIDGGIQFFMATAAGVDVMYEVQNTLDVWAAELDISSDEYEPYLPYEEVDED